MGNGLEKHRKEMSAENFEKFISLLMNTTDLLLMRRKYDKAVEGAEVVQIENTEIYNGSAGNILGRIHSSGPAVDINKLTVPFLVGSMNNDDRSLPANILEAIAKKWRDKDLNGVRKKLLKYKSKLGESEDDKTIQFSDTISLDKKFDVAPKMPPESEREKMAHHWTAFGFFPKSEEKMKMWIDQNMERTPYKRIGTEEAVVFSDWGEIIGRIEPVKSRTARTDIEINSLEEIGEVSTST